MGQKIQLEKNHLANTWLILGRCIGPQVETWHKCTSDEWSSVTQSHVKSCNESSLQKSSGVRITENSRRALHLLCNWKNSFGKMASCCLFPLDEVLIALKWVWRLWLSHNSRTLSLYCYSSVDRPRFYGASLASRLLHFLADLLGNEQLHGVSAMQRESTV